MKYAKSLGSPNRAAGAVRRRIEDELVQRPGGGERRREADHAQDAHHVRTVPGQLDDQEEEDDEQDVARTLPTPTVVSGESR